MVVVHLWDRQRRIVPEAVRIAVRHTGQDDRSLHGELLCVDEAGQVVAAFDLRDVVADITDQSGTVPHRRRVGREVERGRATTGRDGSGWARWQAGAVRTEQPGPADTPHSAAAGTAPGGA